MATRQTLEETFALVEAAAIEGVRCPLNSGSGGPLLPGNLTTLARDGRVLVEISTKNWRRVTILTGPNAGKSTAASPHKSNRVYQTIDRRGAMVNGRLVDHGASSRRQPSLPRPLTREELA